MRWSAGSKPRLRSPGGAMLAASYALVAWGCQAVFGDFTITPEPATEPSEILGTACEPGAYRCVNQVLQTCRDDRKDWITAEVCASVADCNLNTRNCRPCVPGEHMCRENLLERCDDLSMWAPAGAASTCESPALCSVAPDRMSGSCTEPACPIAGAHSCQNGRLSRCSKDRDAVEVVAQCETSELCDPVYADALAATGAPGACRPPACAPNAFSCEGTTLKRCAFDRTVWEEVSVCDSPDLCSAGRGTCGACAAGEIECNGAELRRCTDGLTWATLDTCGSVAQCDAEAGSCRRAQCSEPGAYRCGNELGFPELAVCSSDGVWKVVEVCSTIELCNATAGRCLPPACEPEKTRCRGDRHERCSEDLTRWELTTTCGADQICDALMGCLPGPCVDGNVRCNGQSLERCVFGRFEETELCETAALCDPGTTSGVPACKMPLCSAGFSCMNADIMQCSPGRDAQTLYRSCLVGTCDAEAALVTGRPECDNCTPYAYRCDGMSLLRCSADGQLEQMVKACLTTCSATPGAVPSCP